MPNTSPKLTTRDRAIIHLVVAGCTNRQIASKLGIGEQSVKNALSTIYLKCVVRNRAQLVTYALRNGLA